jgi:hypothetical protein
MRFRLQDGEMKLVDNNILGEMRQLVPFSTAYIVDMPRIKETIKSKSKNFLKNTQFATAPVVIGSQGVFWKAFLVYIFPWMLDIAKVYCAIRIAQAFYQEKRGGRDDGTGMGAVVTFGKWYLIFWLIPWAVELIDQIGGTMFNDLTNKGVDLNSTVQFKMSK